MQQARDSASQPSVLIDIAGVKPIEVLKRLRTEFQKDPSKRQQFDDAAGANAVMGNCPKSWESFRSGEHIALARRRQSAVALDICVCGLRCKHVVLVF